MQVVGDMSNKGERWRKFAQTFFLAEQPTGYFVLNDIFRYLKEDGDELHGDEDVPTPVDLGPPVSSPINRSNTEFGAMDQVVFQQPRAQPSTSTYEEPEAALSPNKLAHPNGFHSSFPAQSTSPPAPSPQVPITTQIEQVTQVPITEPTPVSQLTEKIEPPEPAEKPESSPNVEKEASDEESTDPAGDSPHQSSVNAKVEKVETPKIQQEPEQSTSSTPSLPPSPNPPSSQIEDEQPAITVPSPPKLAASPAPPPTPATQGQVAKKSWATLAAGAPKGKAIADARGVIVAPSPVQQPSQAPSAIPSSSSSAGGDSGTNQNNVQKQPAQGFNSFTRSQMRFDASSFNQTTCYVKNVERDIPQAQVKATLTKKFGPLVELDFDFGRNCAFIEFTSVEAARRAVMASFPPVAGGEGGILIASGGRTWTMIIEPKRTKQERQSGSGPSSMRDMGPTGVGGNKSRLQGPPPSNANKPISNEFKTVGSVVEDFPQSVQAGQQSGHKKNASSQSGGQGQKGKQQRSTSTSTPRVTK